MLGSSLGALTGAVGEAVGAAIGMVGGSQGAAEAHALPAMLFLAVSETMVYGMHTTSRWSEPDTLTFRIPREGLTVKVHERVAVRVLELIVEQTGARIELEGSRVPLTHARDVMDVLTQGG